MSSLSSSSQSSSISPQSQSSAFNGVRNEMYAERVLLCVFLRCGVTDEVRVPQANYPIEPTILVSWAIFECLDFSPIRIKMNERHPERVLFSCVSHCVQLLCIYLQRHRETSTLMVSVFTVNRACDIADTGVYAKYTTKAWMPQKARPTVIKVGYLPCILIFTIIVPSFSLSLIHIQMCIRDRP